MQYLVGIPRTGSPPTLTPTTILRLILSSYLLDTLPTFHRWPLPTLVIATACSASLEQSFLIFRFWKLRHAGSEMQRQMRESATRRFHKLRDTFMAGFLGLLVCTHVRLRRAALPDQTNPDLTLENSYAYRRGLD